MYPILYSFRRCPYAIRARLALRYCGIQVALREVILADKPVAMLEKSAKGTVPVLVLDGGDVIDESLDIMLWALLKNDPDNWQVADKGDTGLSQLANELIEINDGYFKQHLDHYKYADRFPEFSREHYRNQAEVFLQKLEVLLEQHQYLICNQVSYVDMALFPFIRQFAFVDKGWFDHSSYKQLQLWLDNCLMLPLFADIMQKYPQWNEGDDITVF